MLTELMLAAMESSEYRTMQYPDDNSSGSGWGILILIIVIVVVLWLILLLLGSWRKGKR